MEITDSLRQTVAVSLVPNFGPVKFKKLLERHGSLNGAFQAFSRQYGKKDELLSEADKESDRCLVRGIPHILERAGYKIEKI